MNYYKLSNNTLTLKSGYFASGISLSLVLSFWIFIDVFADYYKSGISYELLRQAINKNEYQSALEISINRLTPRLSNKIFNKIITIFPGFVNLAKKQHLPTTLVTATVQHKIFDINNAINENDFSKSQSLLKDVKDSISKLEIANVNKLEQIINSIENSLQTLKIESTNIKKYKTDYENLESEKTRLTRRHQLVADEFGIFLSLEPAYQKGKEFDVYQVGVLTGLPILKDLKDNIASLPLLKEELDRIGGSVNIQAQNAYEVFTGRLLSLRESSEHIRKDYRNTLSEIEMVKKEEEETKKIIDINKKSIDENVKNLFLEINF